MRKDTIRLNSDMRMVAHRGLSGLELENTASAFVAAGNRSYFGIETDIHRTVDGKYVVIHDGDTVRVGGGGIHVETTPMEQLRRITLADIDGKRGRADLHLPTLKEYIDTCARYEKHGFLEIKGAFSVEWMDEIMEIIGKEEAMRRYDLALEKLNV